MSKTPSKLFSRDSIRQLDSALYVWFQITGQAKPIEYGVEP